MKSKKKYLLTVASSCASYQGLARVAHSACCCYLLCVVDIARDTSDTEASDTLEYEPVTESDEDDGPVDADSSECSDVSIHRIR